ncbi:HNH endonuclease [uncultured Clostridium sp.]|uniref:HNH endonuclease n=1 Tax=uncultured Clostridium sp. TaxID=59620 RepID=UPI0025DC522D|nr:HNH endonuclease [uncultured Clostridium sp.]
MGRKRMCPRCGKMNDFAVDCSCKKENRRYEKSDKFYSHRKWREKRASIIKRDGGYCKRCYIKYGIINTEDLTVHHIKSRLHYPELSYNDENLICICMTCNNQLGVKNKLDFEWEYEEETREFIL